MGPSLLKHSICPEQGLVHSILASIGLGDLEPRTNISVCPAIRIADAFILAEFWIRRWKDKRPVIHTRTVSVIFHDWNSLPAYILGVAFTAIGPCPDFAVNKPLLHPFGSTIW